MTKQPPDKTKKPYKRGRSMTRTTKAIKRPKKRLSTTKTKPIAPYKQTTKTEKQLYPFRKPSSNGHRPPKSIDTTRLQITRLLISGVQDVNVIANKLQMQQQYVRNHVTKIRADVLSMSIEEYRSLLNTKLVQLLHNHTTISSTIALELHSLDTDIHNCDELIKMDDASKDAKLTPMQVKRATLASTRLTMLREQRDNNASLFQTLGKVGVSQVTLEKKKEVSLPVSPSNNISLQKGGSTLEVSKNSLVSTESESGDSTSTAQATLGNTMDISGYGGVSKVAALAELKRSTRQMDKYLKGQEKEKAESQQGGGQDDK